MIVWHSMFIQLAVFTSLYIYFAESLQFFNFLFLHYFDPFFCCFFLFFTFSFSFVIFVRFYFCFILYFVLVNNKNKITNWTNNRIVVNICFCVFGVCVFFFYSFKLTNFYFEMAWKYSDFCLKKFQIFFFSFQLHSSWSSNYE